MSTLGDIGITDSPTLLHNVFFHFHDLAIAPFERWVSWLFNDANGSNVVESRNGPDRDGPVLKWNGPDRSLPSRSNSVRTVPRVRYYGTAWAVP